ncbi:MAG: hypothetical protein A3I29_04130 [Candidatus Magasanikbacteria bacterium RIFCSPLOWO2_02_FULL_44_11]|uniref:Methyltransferase type 11 domain-containing protein n=2 Tax=Candidatus Magasanikiibacteriota TaxID=1752731 RepID=A0A1F6N9S7_9BACT|nr:MAG: hypothetical protein A3D53_02860 [Candidatus Magasanikbacteria bacterium RIFCSPHIGHO2_02_FULL_45_10]OGH80601.1 MAG: hypothetical protein A3I29_04130 [Candidatus Magasanikbacteria bacterium RIFCSPLOWO2_02_FULL_44_11]
MDIEKEKIEKLWNKEAYYQLIENAQGKGEESKFFINIIADIINKHNPTSILDVGCGEGGVISDLAQRTSGTRNFSGVDVAAIGIKRSKKKGVTNATFELYDGLTIPFSDGKFELAFSTFVFEHLTKPERVFAEMGRVTKQGGYILIACPNYGSPFFRSPCNKENKTVLLLKRLVKSFMPKFFFTESFCWEKVTPIILDKEDHIIDYDTTIEPNLVFFMKHIKTNPIYEIVEANSFWGNFTYGGVSRAKKIFLETMSFLGKHNFPFIKYYGPFFFILLKKV